MISVQSVSAPSAPVKREVQYLTERKSLTGTEEVVTAWITTDLSLEGYYHTGWVMAG